MQSCRSVPAGVIRWLDYSSRGRGALYTFATLLADPSNINWVIHTLPQLTSQHRICVYWGYHLITKSGPQPVYHSSVHPHSSAVKGHHQWLTRSSAIRRPDPGRPHPSPGYPGCFAIFPRTQWGRLGGQYHQYIPFLPWVACPDAGSSEPGRFWL